MFLGIITSKFRRGYLYVQYLACRYEVLFGTIYTFIVTPIWPTIDEVDTLQVEFVKLRIVRNLQKLNLLSLIFPRIVSLKHLEVTSWGADINSTSKGTKSSIWSDLFDWYHSA